jgi:Flp pilus assembly protein TadD
MKNVTSDASQLFEIYKNVGNIHVRAGDFESAEEFYNKAYTLKPDSDVLMVNYGTLEIQRESIEDAVQRFRCAVDINPNNDKGWVGLALVHRQMGDHELAWANIQRALDINRNNRTAIRLVVDWGIADNRESIAVERLQDYLEAEGEDAEMSFTLAKVFTHIGRLAEARLELERVLALDPMVEGAERLKKLLDREISARKAMPAAEKN